MSFFLRLCVSVMLLTQSVALAQLSIQATQSTICAGTSVTLYAVGIPSNATVSWQPGGSTNKYLDVSPSVTTTYTVTSGGNSVDYTVFVCNDPQCTTSSFSPLLLNTGNDGLNKILGYGQTDTHWMLSRTINGTYTSAVVSDNAHIPGNYSRPIWPNAQWIGPNGTLTTGAAGTFFYRVQFNLTAQEASSLVLNMQFMADNTVMGVRVNDVLVPNSGTPGGTNYGFQSPNAAAVNMQGNWVEGLNTLTVEIYDEGGYSGFVAQLNPTVVIPPTNVTCEETVFIAEDTLQICRGDSVQLEAHDVVSYSWLPVEGLSDPSIANPKASPSTTTTYVVRGTDLAGHSSYDSVVVLVNEAPTVNLGSKDTIKCSDQPMIVYVLSEGNTVLWQDGSSNTTYAISDTGTYYVQVTNACGVAYDTLRVHSCCEAIDIPNLFTPNEDQHNEYFNIGCLGTGGWNLKVFNCWGGLVYSNDDYQNNWNGNQVSDGVYYYQLSKSGKYEYKGWVHILR